MDALGPYGLCASAIALDGQGDPIVVAVKRFNKHGLQVDGERGTQRLLVYEFMPNRSLEDHLFNTTSTLPWRTRLEVMLGAAKGLAYLHKGFEVKAKLSDFGLAREGKQAIGLMYQRRVDIVFGFIFIKVVGTYGYAAPEYVETGHLTIQSDIWAFGVVLYEMLTGRRTVERNRPTSEQKLLDWVKRFPPDSGRFGMILDPRLRGNYSLSAAQKLGKLANSC
ncbi:beta-amylase 3 [Hibiscus syriacus]|uniref:Beta-amylase 3 n=1 Tax=Hibiscus syriacus TaxID=106335 RepID=A0A6A2YIS7_HIBSY|nr:beta-amylase 3 [Hibiscus syriacus]